MLRCYCFTACATYVHVHVQNHKGWQQPRWLYLVHRCRLLCVCMARESWLLMVLTMGTKQQTAIENTVLSTCSLLQWTLFLQWVCFVCNNESWNTLACGNKFFIYKTRAHIMLMIIAFYCGIIDTNKPFMIQIFGINVMYKARSKKSFCEQETKAGSRVLIDFVFFLMRPVPERLSEKQETKVGLTANCGTAWHVLSSTRQGCSSRCGFLCTGY